VRYNLDEELQEQCTCLPKSLFTLELDWKLTLSQRESQTGAM